jgi:hypothetical protein
MSVLLLISLLSPFIFLSQLDLYVYIFFISTNSALTILQQETHRKPHFYVLHSIDSAQKLFFLLLFHMQIEIPDLPIRTLPWYYLQHLSHPKNQNEKRTDKQGFPVCWAI